MKIAGVTIPPRVAGALAQAAEATGVSFELLARTAARESSFNPAARAATSSAAGLFQFLDATWLKTVARHGAKHGLGAEAAAVAGGADAQTRQAVLDLRFDPDLAARMAGELARDNAQALARRLGRPATAGEVYAAHFLGAAGAGALIRLAERTPHAPAAEAFPAAARANQAIFYDRAGAPRSAARVLENLVATVRAAAPAPAAPPAASANPLIAAQQMAAPPAGEADHRAAMAAVLDMLAGEGGSLARILSGDGRQRLL